MVVAVVVAAAFCAMGVSAVHIRGKADYVPYFLRHQQEQVEACKCLNWQESYAAGLVECGQGFEFTRALGYPKAKYGTAEEWLKVVQNKNLLRAFQGSMGAEFCESFYKRFNDTKCARTAMDRSETEWYGKSWCYVSSKCETAMAVAGTQVSAKLCVEGEDAMLSEIEPFALMKYGQKMGFSVPGFFVKVAYPVERSFYYDSATSEQIAALKKWQNKTSEHVVLVDKVDEHQDKMLIEGSDLSPKVFNVPNSYEGFKCTSGCSDILSWTTDKNHTECAQSAWGGTMNFLIAPKCPQNKTVDGVYTSGLCEMFYSNGPHLIYLHNATLFLGPCMEHGFPSDKITIVAPPSFG